MAVAPAQPSSAVWSPPLGPMFVVGHVREGCSSDSSLAITERAWAGRADRKISLHFVPVLIHGPSAGTHGAALLFDPMRAERARRSVLSRHSLLRAADARCRD